MPEGRLQRWLLRRRLQRAYGHSLRAVPALHALLDGVEAGDPGTPARALVPHVLGHVRVQQRLGERLVSDGLLDQARYERDRGHMSPLVERCRALGGEAP